MPLYDPAAGTWSCRELGEHFGLHRLVLYGGRLWCFGYWYEWYEGGDYSFWGGLAVLDKDGNLTQIPALEGVPIGGYRFEAGGLAVSTYKEYESDLTYFSPGERHEPSDLARSNYICRLSLDTLEVIGYEKLGDEAVGSGRFQPGRAGSGGRAQTGRGMVRQAEGGRGPRKGTARIEQGGFRGIPGLGGGITVNEQNRLK